MNITFANKKLEKFANDFKSSNRKLGKNRATKYHKRLGDIRDADSFADLEYLPGKYHPLSSDRNGQWACDLDQPYRLVFEPVGDIIPINEHGIPILTEMRIVEILEIVDYHK